MTVSVKAGRAIRKYRVVKSDGSNDLVFQSVKDGKLIRDNNILGRFIKPGTRKIGQPWLNWRSLRTSHAVWLKLAGADVKDAQGLASSRTACRSSYGRPVIIQKITTGFLQPSTTGWMTQVLPGSVVLPPFTAPSTPRRRNTSWHAQRLLDQE